jgi:hypothetical protein
LAKNYLKKLRDHFKKRAIRLAPLIVADIISHKEVIDFTMQI